MDRLFNSVFENSLRLLVLLDKYDLPQTLDMLYMVDFMPLYSKAFGLGEKNLMMIMPINLANLHHSEDWLAKH